MLNELEKLAKRKATKKTIIEMVFSIVFCVAILAGSFGTAIYFNDHSCKMRAKEMNFLNPVYGIFTDCMVSLENGKRVPLNYAIERRVRVLHD